ncbi:MAG: DUF1345 domain-containing protein [Rubrivivax sp.]
MRPWHFVRNRPRLWTSVAAGLLVALALPAGWTQHGFTRALVGWNACALLYLALVWQMARGAEPAFMLRRARAESEGRFLVLTLAVLASAAVLLATGSQLAAMKDLQGAGKTWHVALAGLTLMSSWLFTQALFALHYAHDFYVARDRHRADVLQFPGTEHPDYGDFLYFACVIGTSGQTADVSFSNSALRRVGLVHCVQAFFFNTVVLALTINIAAGMF